MGVWGVFVNCLVLYDNVTVAGGLQPWTGWRDVHAHFSTIIIVPAFLQNPTFRYRQMLTYWVYTATAYIFFIVFAFGEDVREEYDKMWTHLRRKVGKQPVQVAGPFERTFRSASVRFVLDNLLSLKIHSSIVS